MGAVVDVQKEHAVAAQKFVAAGEYAAHHGQEGVAALGIGKTFQLQGASAGLPLAFTHTHAHDHENEHTHSHEDCAHTHCDACGGCEHSPKEELMALMKYMVGHNASHANELANLAKQLQEMGETAAYDQIMLAVSDFEKGNLRLSTVLASMQAPNA